MTRRLRSAATVLRVQLLSVRDECPRQDSPGPVLVDRTSHYQTQKDENGRL